MRAELWRSCKHIQVMVFFGPGFFMVLIQRRS
jgi:hypothetical protein